MKGGSLNFGILCKATRRKKGRARRKEAGR
jgi:hypothetical protein